jgi:hypothetical protein
MDTKQLQTDKLDIISWVSHLQDSSVVEKIKTIMNSESSLSQEQKNAIDEAILSIENSGSTPHNMVMEETKRRFPHLYNR